VTTFVIDASVAVKWFLPSSQEQYSENAFALLKRYVAGQVRFVVPDLFWAEFGNICWKAVRQGRWSQKDAHTAISGTKRRNFPTVSTLVLLEDAIAIATAFDRSVYDSLYIALALTMKSEFVTADERLANAVAARLPVKWIGLWA
jgi:predicted nucleic acid-binding protein